MITWFMSLMSTLVIVFSVERQHNPPTIDNHAQQTIVVQPDPSFADLNALLQQKADQLKSRNR